MKLKIFFLQSTNCGNDVMNFPKAKVCSKINNQQICSKKILQVIRKLLYVQQNKQKQKSLKYIDFTLETKKIMNIEILLYFFFFFFFW